MNLANTKIKRLLEKIGKIPLTTRNVTIILFSLFLVTLISTIYFVNIASSTNGSIEKIRIEIIKSLFQFLAVIIMGGAVAALFKAHERNQEQTKIRTQLKLEFIKRIGELYRATKKIRRLLRYHGITMSERDIAKALNDEQIKFYTDQMLKLNDIQLEIEGFKIASQEFYLFECNKQIFAHLERMENYLNKIIDQFENGFQSLQKDKEVHFNEFKFLWEFTAPSKNEYLRKEELKHTIDSDNGKDVYYYFKKLFSLSYSQILYQLKNPY